MRLSSRFILDNLFLLAAEATTEKVVQLVVHDAPLEAERRAA